MLSHVKSLLHSPLPWELGKRSPVSSGWQKTQVGPGAEAGGAEVEAGTCRLHWHFLLSQIQQEVNGALAQAE